MKKIILIGELILFSTVLFAQTKSDTLNTLTKNTIDNNPFKGMGDDRALFPVLLSGFINLLGTDGNRNLIINPTLYSLFSKDNKLIDYNKYRKQAFTRNISIIIGITPDQVNQLHIDDGIWGVKWILINNKVLSEKDYQKNSGRVSSLVYEVNKYIMKLPHGKTVSQKYLRSKDTVNNLLSDTDTRVITILKQVEGKFNVDSFTAADLINSSFYIQKALQKGLDTKSALYISYNEVYNFNKSQTNAIAFSSDYSFFLGITPFDIAASFTLSADSSQRHSTLIRHILELDLGKNITFRNIKWLELKPAIDFIYT